MRTNFLLPLISNLEKDKSSTAVPAFTFYIYFTDIPFVSAVIVSTETHNIQIIKVKVNFFFKSNMLFTHDIQHKLIYSPPGPTVQ